jgi:hypothetical protein
MQIEEARPPYVTFEVRAVEDRQASIESGYYQTKDVDFAFVTPQGSKDRIERDVKDWFEQLEQQCQQGRFKREWLVAYRGAHAAWKEGREIPVNGTAILTWPVLSPSQAKQAIDHGVRTVEDLAAANEETIMRLGMGGRALKEKAVAWLSAAAGNGKVTEELSAMRAANKDLQARNEGLEKQLKALAAKVEVLSK